MICQKCEQSKPESDFIARDGKERKWCEECRSKLKYKRNEPLEDGILCVSCNKYKPSITFYDKSSRRRKCCSDCREYYNARRAVKPQTPKNLIRPISDMTDMMIVVMIGEGLNTKKIASLLNRDYETVDKRLKQLNETGAFTHIHNKLMNNKGIYALRMKHKARCERGGK